MQSIMWGVFTKSTKRCPHGTLKAVAPSKWRARHFGKTWNNEFHIRPVYMEPTGKDRYRFSQIILRDKDRVYHPTH